MTLLDILNTRNIDFTVEYDKLYNDSQKTIDTLIDRKKYTQFEYKINTFSLRTNELSYREIHDNSFNLIEEKCRNGEITREKAYCLAAEFYYTFLEHERGLITGVLGLVNLIARFNRMAYNLSVLNKKAIFYDESKKRVIVVSISELADESAEALKDKNPNLARQIIAFNWIDASDSDRQVIVESLFQHIGPAGRNLLKKTPISKISEMAFEIYNTLHHSSGENNTLQFVVADKSKWISIAYNGFLQSILFLENLEIDYDEFTRLKSTGKR